MDKLIGALPDVPNSEVDKLVRALPDVPKRVVAPPAKPTKDSVLRQSYQKLKTLWERAKKTRTAQEIKPLFDKVKNKLSQFYNRSAGLQNPTPAASQSK